MKIEIATPDAYKLFHEGALAFAQAEREGIRIDIEYCRRKKEHLERKIKYHQKQLEDTKLYKRWFHIYKNKINIHSNQQLSKILYQIMKIEPTKTTETGQGSTDEDALRRLNVEGIDLILAIRKLTKVKNTYLEAFMREQFEGFIHPSFNLHNVRTYRSCVAKGSKILVMRDFTEHPDGIPIEEVKAGDYVYCFDNDLNPAIRKVLWAGKTGHKEVVRIHWVGKGGHGKGYLDVTPEHLIRLVNGEYRPAADLDPELNDFRNKKDSKHLPKVRVLSCCRVKDTLRFTGHLRHGNGILEHHLIYKEFFGEIKAGEIIHHKNGNHLDHRPENLEKTTPSIHSSYHGSNAPEHIKQKRIKILNDNRHKIMYKYGEENHTSLKLSKWECLRKLAKAKGQVSKVDCDFGTFKKYLKKYEIDPWVARRRYDRNGNYITRRQLKNLGTPIKVGEIVRKFGLNYKKAQQMLEERGFLYVKPGKARNPYGRKGIPGNHIITKIEWIGKTVDVYDIEVEECHNFIANEICVHNSSDGPNFQNIPKRDKEAMKICRQAILPRPGHMLIEADFSALEVNISECYHKDPVMMKYLLDDASDMHLDMAKQIFMMGEMSKKTPAHAILRQGAKNSFVFPQFYGDYYGNNAHGLVEWAKLPNGKWKDGLGIELPDGTTISTHLRAKGIKSFDQFTEHLKAVEDDFWNRRFKAYGQWRKKAVKNYQKRGWLKLHTGFVCSGVMRKNEIVNYPIQGAAFHCLLFTFIELSKIAAREKWKSKIVGQIHDSILIDALPVELDRIKEALRIIVKERLPKAWKWIIVPLEIDIDEYGIDSPWVS